MSAKIKICGLTKPGDAYAAMRAGVDYLGAIFYEKSPRRVPSESLDDLLDAMPDGVRVMVDVLPENEAVEARMSMGFDYFQIHFDLAGTPESRIADYSRILGRERLWLAPRLKPEDPLPDYVFEYAGTLVMDTYRAGKFGGTGETGEWDRFARLKTGHPETRLVLAGGLNPENVANALRTTKADIVDLNSGIESAPGVKDFSKMTAAIVAVREADGA